MSKELPKEDSWLSERNLIQIQGLIDWIALPKVYHCIAKSGLFFGAFLTLHLTNILSAHFGHTLYDGGLELFRKYYQHPVVESGTRS